MSDLANAAPRAGGKAGIAAARARLERSGLARFVLLLAFAALIRYPAYGTWNYDLDDEYYWLIGQRLLQGATLYVDIWDRKGPALYLFYAAIGALSSSALAYQLAATLCAALGAYGVERLARLVTGTMPALLAGIAYCALLNQFGGENGQAPVLYNPLVIAAAWSIAAHLQSLRRGRIDTAVVAGVGAAGLAIAFKQSAAVESLFFGLTIAVNLWRSQVPKPQILAMLAALAIVGALPILATFSYYAAIGHFAEVWQALVSSNLDRTYYTPAERLWYLGVLAGRLALPLAFAVAGALILRRAGRCPPEARFVCVWALVSIGAVAAFPVVFVHYALPVLPSLCVLCGPFFARKSTGPIAAALLVATALLLGGGPDWRTRMAARQVTPRFEAYLREHTPGRRLLVWGAPVALYGRIGSEPPSPILFAPHYYELSESRAIGRDPVVELRRILAWQPETVVIQDPVAMMEPNVVTIALVRAYSRRCRAVRRFALADHNGLQKHAVYTGCARAGP